jgi:hypothetical protein
MAVTAQMFTQTCPTEISEGVMYQISPKLVKNWKVWVDINPYPANMENMVNS